MAWRRPGDKPLSGPMMVSLLTHICITRPQRVNIQWTLQVILYKHYDDVTMGAMTSQITSLTSVCSTVYSGADQSKHQSSASLAFVRGIHRGPVNSPHKWPVTWKMFPFDDVIMDMQRACSLRGNWTSCWRRFGQQYVLIFNDTARSHDGYYKDNHPCAVSSSLSYYSLFPDWVPVNEIRNQNTVTVLKSRVAVPNGTTVPLHHNHITLDYLFNKST